MDEFAHKYEYLIQEMEDISKHISELKSTRARCIEELKSLNPSYRDFPALVQIAAENQVRADKCAVDIEVNMQRYEVLKSEVTPMRKKLSEEYIHVRDYNNACVYVWITKLEYNDIKDNLIERAKHMSIVDLKYTIDRCNKVIDEISNYYLGRNYRDYVIHSYEEYRYLNKYELNDLLRTYKSILYDRTHVRDAVAVKIQVECVQSARRWWQFWK